MGFFGRSSKNQHQHHSHGAKNPQSGANSFSSSSGQSESQESSDVNVPTVNLTEQRLQDWKAGGVLVGNGVDGGSGGGVGGGGANAGNGAGAKGLASPPRNYTTSPNNLILLIERGRWAEASRRAQTHEHEVRQLVKLRKTTKNAAPPSNANTGAEQGAASAAGGGAAAGGSGGGSSGGGRRNVQISNVKCKALHHACQKLRSVHTTIYQRTNEESLPSDESNGNGKRRIIEEDEYIEACKCILTLIRIHPEACKERESRHGCLPLHLCVFSMCATPPPPMVPPSEKGNKKGKGHHRSNSGGGRASPRPPVASRSISAPPKPPSLNLPTPTQQSGKHRTIPSNSSQDFSLGNISQMIQEESEHQQKLTEHRESTKNKGNEAEAGSVEEAIYQGMEDMERLLIGLESKYEAREDKKRRDKESKKRGKKGETTTTETTTTTEVVNAMTPMDCLEERSRETDSHSTPQDKSNGSGGSGNVVSDGRTGAAIDAKSDGAALTRNNGNNAGNDNDNLNSTAPRSSTKIAPKELTYEELQRRYLQINSPRRDEYSVRVLNALLDAWPKSVKTSSEGGRLPLHMACFGRATVKVMETVLKAYPDAARQRNHDGFLPVHIAAHWGVSHPDIAPLILRAYPDGAVGRNRWERTPIEEALGMAGENGRRHQLSLVWSLRRHPTYWIHNDVAGMLLPRNVRNAPWRVVDAGDSLPNSNEGGNTNPVPPSMPLSGRFGGGGAVDVDEVGISDEEDGGVEVQMAQSSSSTIPNLHDPKFVRALAESTDLSLLITKDKHWEAAALRCRSHPQEAREALEVKVRGAYTAKITPLHYACENRPTVEVVRTLVEACPAALERRQEPGGQLPIHAACTWGASPEVISTLLKAQPAAAEMKDFLSNLPLHCACYSGAETVVVEELLRVYPQGVWPRNHQGSSAVDIVRRLTHDNRREVLNLLERTMGRLLARARAAAAGEEEGVEVDKDNSLEWV